MTSHCWFNPLFLLLMTIFLLSESTLPETSNTFPCSLTMYALWYLNSYHHLELVVVHLILVDPPLLWISSEWDFHWLFLIVLETWSKYHCCPLTLVLNVFCMTLLAPTHSATLFIGILDLMMNGLLIWNPNSAFNPLVGSFSALSR
jgi:hypothetical protein